MKIILCSLIFLSASSLAETNPYDGSHWELVEGKSAEVKYSEVVKKVNIKNLIDASRKMHLAALNIISGKPGRDEKLRYIEAFPRDFEVFVSVFHPTDFGQLYDGFIYIKILEKLITEFPAEVGDILLRLSSEACLDADAPNYLRHALVEFEKIDSKRYRILYEKLNESRRNNILTFRAASLHDGGAGVCDF